jgi:hypothetical protein
VFSGGTAQTGDVLAHHTLVQTKAPSLDPLTGDKRDAPNAGAAVILNRGIIHARLRWCANFLILSKTPCPANKKIGHGFHEFHRN